MGPRAIPEEWVRDDKVVHYLIPKTFVDWLKPKFGETGLYSLMAMGGLALASKEYLVFHIETKIAIEFFITWSLLNMMFGDSVREMAADQFTASNASSRSSSFQPTKTDQLGPYVGNRIFEQTKQT